MLIFGVSVVHPVQGNMFSNNPECSSINHRIICRGITGVLTSAVRRHPFTVQEPKSNELGHPKALTQTQFWPRSRRRLQQESQIEPDAARFREGTNMLEWLDPVERCVDEEQADDVKRLRERVKEIRVERT